MKPSDLKPKTHIDFNKENKNKDPGFEVGDKREYRNISLQKVTLQVYLKKFLWLNKLKHCVVERFY